ncbi:DUF3040 domain-containing protein [Nonomuraea fuscirosea]|uniref:DUF3040 domain-containing protein n=1 Tax=Nonomuraea fuscirosea TaxID=1291556 RepID=UPI003405E46B
MDLSDRERRILGEIEQELRRGDRAFVRRIESLNAACRRTGAQRYAAHTTWRELWCVLLLALALAALAVLLVLSAGGARAPAPPRVPAPSHALAPMPALRPVSRARSDSACAHERNRAETGACRDPYRMRSFRRERAEVRPGSLG